MRKLAIVLVAVTVLFAGCIAPGGGESPTPSETTTDTEAGTQTAAETTTGTEAETPTESVEQTTETSGQGNSSGWAVVESFKLVSHSTGGDNSSTRSLTEAKFTYYHGMNQSNIQVKQEDGRLLVSNNFTGTNLSARETVYSTDDYIAVRNHTAGDVTYTDPDNESATNRVRELKLVIGLATNLYDSMLDWQQTGTTTVDGSDAQVYESDTLNTTNESAPFDTSNVQSVEARKVVDSTGVARSMTVKIITPSGTYGVEVSTSFDDDVAVSKPDWVDESQSP